MPKLDIVYVYPPKIPISPTVVSKTPSKAHLVVTTYDGVSPMLYSKELLDILKEIDEDGSGEIEFGEFCQLCAKFLVEDPDIETMKRELKDAFRLYDKAGEGFITMDTLRELISELLAPLSADELDGIIDELDEDGSDTMDFDEFCEMMMSAPEK